MKLCGYNPINQYHFKSNNINFNPKETKTIDILKKNMDPENNTPETYMSVGKLYENNKLYNTAIDCYIEAKNISKDSKISRDIDDDIQRININSGSNYDCKY